MNLVNEIKLHAIGRFYRCRRRIASRYPRRCACPDESIARDSPRRARLFAIALLFICSAEAVGAFKNQFTVAPDGTGDFRSVQDAIDAAPSHSPTRFTIEIKPGVYRQVVTVPKHKPNIALISADAAKTILTYDNSAQTIGLDGQPLGTGGSATAFIYAADFVAENITFENSAGRVGPAVAVVDTADRSIFRKCRFIGWQDTLYINGGRDYFEDCTIAGHVDFIFGAAIAWFERCEVHCRQRGAITAASTPSESPFGYVFNRCRITSDAPPASQILGRPWRPFAAVTFLHCEMADAIKPVGWDNWNSADNEKTARYAEFNSTGPGAHAGQRAAWSTQLTEVQAKVITAQTVLGGQDHWQPTTPVETKLPQIDRPRIPGNTFVVTEFGAIGDGTTPNTAAIKDAIAAAAQAGGGKIVVPSGKFLTAGFELSSNTELHLTQGAVLLLSDTFSDYDGANPNRYENQIVAKNAHDIAITGQGTIDGQGKAWWDEFDKTSDKPINAGRMKHRPFMVVITGCQRVLVQGVTLTNSPMFHLVPQASRDVVIDSVHFLAPADAPNTDALDPSGWNFLIVNCTFDVGDDCIAIKPTGKAEPGHLSCEDFYITRCTFLHGHGLSIGGQTPGGLRRLIVRDCTFENTDAGIRMKADRGTGGLVEDCVYENLTMTRVKVPVYITSYYPEKSIPKTAKDDPAQPVNVKTPIWRNIRIRNVTAIGATTAGKIVGLPEMPVQDILFTDVSVDAIKGFSIWNASSVRFINFQLKIAKGNPTDVQSAEVSMNAVTSRPSASVHPD